MQFSIFNFFQHSENTNTFTSMTFDLLVWPWLCVKVKEAYVIRCCVLYCTLVRERISVGVKVNEIWPFVNFVTFDLYLWPLASVKVTFTIISTCTFWCILVPRMMFVGSIEFEIWTNVWRKLKWCHNDVITHLIFIKFIY